MRASNTTVSSAGMNSDIARAPRLFVEADLAPGSEIACERGQTNYLVSVMRLREGARVRIFNGRDGEWLAGIAQAKRGACTLRAIERLKEQTGPADIELGVSALRPVMTAYTVAERVNLERMRANAIEAAEQCNILWVPAVEPPRALREVLAGWPRERRLLFCDEAAPVTSPVEALSGIDPGPLAVLIGPEGGFNNEEREVLREAAFTVPISLGPRIMRADTAAVAALALVNAVLGDWR